MSREIAATDTAVVSIGSVRSRHAVNIIPYSAELQLSVRTFDENVRTRVLAAIERIIMGETQTSAADRLHVIEMLHSFPAVVNDVDAMRQVGAAFAADLAQVMVVDPGVITGSEDGGILAVEPGSPCAYWILGGADPAEFAGMTGIAEIAERVATLPSNHSPLYAPVIEPTLSIGIKALSSAALSWLSPEAGG